MDEPRPDILVEPLETLTTAQARAIALEAATTKTGRSTSAKSILFGLKSRGWNFDFEGVSLPVVHRRASLSGFRPLDVKRRKDGCRWHRWPF